MTRDVIDRLDALIHKRRSYVAQGGSAGAGATAGEPAASGAGDDDDDDDDVPTLTEVVELAGGPDIADLSTEPAGAAPAVPVVDAMTDELAAALQQRLADELPPLLDTAFAHFSADVRAGIAKITEAAVRDFLQQRRR